MDGFKNSTKMKYMCGGPVRKATGGAIKSVAPKGLLKTAAGAKVAAKAMGTAKTAPKGLLKSAAGAKIVAKASDLAKKAAPEMAKRQVQPTPPKDAKTMGGEPRRSDEGISAKRLLAGTAGDYAAPPEKAKTVGGMTMGKSPLDGLTKSPMTGPLGSVAKNPPKGGAALSKMARSVAGTGQKEGPMTDAPKKATAAPRGMEALKAIGSVGVVKKGVPVASNKPMIGLKTGGHVTKSMTKW